LQEALSLELGQVVLLNEVFGQLRRLSLGIFTQEFADHLIEQTPIDEVTAPQVPDKPFAGAEVGRQHVFFPASLSEFRHEGNRAASSHTRQTMSRCLGCPERGRD
jgi:hypothetical protein